LRQLAMRRQLRRSDYPVVSLVALHTNTLSQKHNYQDSVINEMHCWRLEPENAGCCEVMVG
jgi:hypothetical protein